MGVTLSEPVLSHMNRLKNALLAAQESSQSVPDADESQDTSAQQPEEIIGEYVGGELRDVRVTVRWLEDNPDYEREDPNEGHFVHLTIEVWAGDDGTELQPDHWQIDWFHFVGLLQDNLWEYLKECCPYPERVWEVAEQVPLPLPLWGLFRRPTDKAQALLARLKEVPPYGNN